VKTFLSQHHKYISEVFHSMSRQFPPISKFFKYTRLALAALGILVIYLTIQLSSPDLPLVNADTSGSSVEIESLAPTTDATPQIGWEITARSGKAEIALAKHLAKKGVKIYGAYWCPHCYEQKQLFGKQAWAIVPHIECAEDAKDNPQPKVCTKAGIKGFPTWKIRGKLDAGVKQLAELGKLTGYQGNTNFKYDRLFKG
jgi:thiol-disulfide isomerase/thioredoxin